MPVPDWCSKLTCIFCAIEMCSEYAGIAQHLRFHASDLTQGNALHMTPRQALMSSLCSNCILVHFVL